MCRTHCVLYHLPYHLREECAAEPNNPVCFECGDKNCLDDFLLCSGFSDEQYSKLVENRWRYPSLPPLPPSPPAPPSSPTPPCNEADAKVYDNSSAWNALLTSCGSTCGSTIFQPEGPDCAAQCLRENSLSADCANCAGQYAACTANKCLVECAADPTAPGCLACADANCLDAFQSCSGRGGCNEADADVYANTPVWAAFSVACGEKCGAPQLLNPDSTCFADCARGNLSRRCADCAGEHAHCSLDKCLTESKLTRTSRGLCTVCAGHALYQPPARCTYTRIAGRRAACPLGAERKRVPYVPRTVAPQGRVRQGSRPPGLLCMRRQALHRPIPPLLGLQRRAALETCGEKTALPRVATAATVASSAVSTASVSSSAAAAFPAVASASNDRSNHCPVVGVGHGGRVGRMLRPGSDAFLAQDADRGGTAQATSAQRRRVHYAPV